MSEHAVVVYEVRVGPLPTVMSCPALVTIELPTRMFAFSVVGFAWAVLAAIVKAPEVPWLIFTYIYVVKCCCKTRPTPDDPKVSESG